MFVIKGSSYGYVRRIRDTGGFVLTDDVCSAERFDSIRDLLNFVSKACTAAGVGHYDIVRVRRLESPIVEEGVVE